MSPEVSGSPAVNVTALSKRYLAGFRGGGILALAEASLAVQRGEIFGLLGPNGAGKTTLIKVLLGVLRPTAGSAEILGCNIRSWRAREHVGFLPENHRFPAYLTAREMLLVFGGMSGVPREKCQAQVDGLLELVGMSRWRDTKIKKYSKGMMQRVGLAQALLNDPEVVFLDEPTDGVDPVGRHEIRNALLELKRRGKTVFLNSHLLAEVEAVCDRVAILDHGRVIKVGPTAGLLHTRPGYRIETAALDAAVVADIKTTFAGASIEAENIDISLDQPREINAVIDYLRARKIDILAITPHRMSLEESFLQLVKGAGADE